MQITKHLRLDKKDKRGLVPLYFSITCNGWQHRMATGEKILPGNFDIKNNRVSSRQNGYVAINGRIDDLYKKIENIGLQHGKELTKAKFELLLKEAMTPAPVEASTPTLSFTELY